MWKNNYSLKSTSYSFRSCLGPAVASFLIPGFGQLLNRQERKGLTLLVSALVLLALPVFLFSLTVGFIMIDWNNLTWTTLNRIQSPAILTIIFTTILLIALPLVALFASVDAFREARRRLLERQRVKDLLIEKMLQGKLQITDNLSPDDLQSINITLNDPQELLKTIQEAAREAHDKIGKINILIVGKAGVGKSTLINTVFHEDYAKTGQGRSVTTTIQEYSKKGAPLIIFDTPGLEPDTYKQAIKDIDTLITQREAESDFNRHIHLAWYCLSEGSSRGQSQETDMVNMLVKRGIPTIIVITKAEDDEEGLKFQGVIEGLFPKACRVLRVRALEIKYDYGDVLPPIGLDKLVEYTWEMVPEAYHSALAAALKGIIYKERQAHITVAAAAASAAAIGAIPFPFADALLLIPLQVAMLARISAIYGLKVDKAFLGTLAGGTISSASGTILGRLAVTNLLKLIPGAGSLVSGAISATVASTLTTSFGEAYIRTMTQITTVSSAHAPKPLQIREAFKDNLNQIKIHLQDSNLTKSSVSTESGKS